MHSPYQVWRVSDTDYFFKTDNNAVYKICFLPDDSIWLDDAYQFVIINEDNKPSPNDSKLKTAILLILESFFETNRGILLYICETGDGKQAMRNRLFIRWFTQYPLRHLYYLDTVEIAADGIDNFAAIIVRTDNPRLSEIAEQFKLITSTLKEKP